MVNQVIFFIYFSILSPIEKDVLWSKTRKSDSYYEFNLRFLDYFEQADESFFL